jgi:hypothetical protein
MAANPVPIAIAKRADRRRLLERLDKLGDLAGLMKQPGGLAEAPEPVPLHRAGRGTAIERTTS